MPAPDREVEHLSGKDEHGHETGQRRGAVVELTAGPAQGQTDAACCDDGRGDRRGRVKETVRDVHPVASWLWLLVAHCLQQAL